MARKAPLEQLARKVPLGLPVLLEQQEHKAPLGPSVLLVLLEPLEPLEPLERKGLLARLVR